MLELCSMIYNFPIGDRWTRSNWAFLNDPPESHMNYAPGKYTAQFDVATKANKYSDQLYTFQAGSSPIL
jgi:hypothetical protein